MRVDKLLSLIPAEALTFLAAQTKVNYQVKKLSGELVFRLILFAMLNNNRISLRVMETLFLSAEFRHFAHTECTTRHSSLRDRIASINPAYFHSLFDLLFHLYNDQLKEQKAIAAVDSTYISLSAKLFSWGMHNGMARNKARQVKYTLGLKGSLPCRVSISTQQQFISDNLAMGELLQHMPVEDTIVTFDRGIQSRKVLDSLSSGNRLFVGRAQPGCRYTLTLTNTVEPKPAGSTVTVYKDIRCYLPLNNSQNTTHEFRLIEARVDHKPGEVICFLTNCFDLSAYEVAAIYKQRWNIEVFFKFLKQHLNLKHLTCRSQNAIEVMLYMTLITSMLIIVYKKSNNIKGYKIALLRFEIELDNLMIKEIVELCGGDPNKASHLWNST